jgi:RND family efflux transporter MFP subunit
MHRQQKKVIVIVLATFILISGLVAAGPETAPDGTDPSPTFDCVIEPSEIVDVGSAVPGVIETMQVDRSDLVRKGMTLAKLESGTEHASVKLAKMQAQLTTSIELRKANAGYNRRKQSRNRELFQKAIISKNDMDLTKTEAYIAQLQVRQEKDNQLIASLEWERARKVLERRTIHSPIDGVVMERFKSVGEYVKDTPVMRVAQLDPLHVEVILPVNMLGQVPRGIRAEVTLDLPGQAKQVATVTRVDRVSDAASGTFCVQLNLPNPEYKIPSGLRCRLTFLPETAPAAPEPEALSPSIPISTVTAIQPPVPSLADKQAVVIPNPATPTAATAGIEASAPDPIPRACYAIGPLPDAALAERLMQALGNSAEDMLMREERDRTSSRYLVLASQQTSSDTAQALFNRIKAAGITDIAILRRGPHQGRVSLGFYRNQSVAIRWQAKLAAKDILAEVVEQHRGRPIYWLDLTLSGDIASMARLRETASAIATDANLQSTSCPQQLATR